MKNSFLSQERKLEVDTTPRQTLSQTLTPPISSSKDPVILPKNQGLHLLLPPFFIKIVFTSEFRVTSGNYSFSLGISMYP